MKFGIHSMVWVGDWSPESARFAIQSSAEAGYDVIELSAIEPEAFGIERTRKLLEEFNLEPTVSLGLDAATNVASEDPEIVAAGRKRLDQALTLVRDTGGTMLTGVIFQSLQKYAAPMSARGRANSVETIQALADKAAESGITLGMEFCNRYETNIMNTVEESLTYIAEVDRPNVMSHIDTYHMNIEERSLGEGVRTAAAAGKLGYVHVGESHRGAPGTGTVPWDEFFTALREVEYDGIVTFESFSSAVVHPSFSNTLAIWRNLWTDNKTLAADALEFMKSKLAKG